MNIKKLIIFILIVAIAYAFNYYYLELSAWTFTGIFLLLWIFIGFLSILVIKLYKKKRGIQQSEDSYVFPDVLSNIMKKVDIRTQYEASLLSISFILIGLVAMAIYTVTFMDVSGWAKFMITFNMFWGFIFLTSFLVTNYQQYVSYLQTEKLMNEFGGEGSKEFIPIQPTLPTLPTLPLLPTDEKKDLIKVKGGQKKHG